MGKRLTILAAALALAAFSAEAQRAAKGVLRDSALVVTQELDTAALAVIHGWTNEVQAAVTNDRAMRASEDMRVENVASNLFLIAQAARHAGDTNLAAVLEVTRTNLLQHYTAQVDAERHARSTNTAAWADVIMTDSRTTNAATRALSTNALEVAAASFSVSTQALNVATGAAAALNRVQKLYTADGTRWMDATGGVWLVHGWDTNALRVTASTVSADYEVMVGTEWPWMNNDPEPSGYFYSYASGMDTTVIGRVYPDGGVWRLDLYNNDQPSLFGGGTPAGTYTGAVGSVTFSYETAAGNSATSALPRVAFVDDLPPPYPTNFVAGMTWRDEGSNCWVRVTVSNYIFSIWRLP